MTQDEPKEIREEFNQMVNMTPAELRRWLDTEESQSVGMTPGGEKVTDPEQGEAVGHHMGRVILAVQAKHVGDYDDDDYASMRKVIGYVHRHGKQRPSGDVTDTRWRHSLMNWGHDPMKG